MATNKKQPIGNPPFQEDSRTYFDPNEFEDVIQPKEGSTPDTVERDKATLEDGIASATAAAVSAEQNGDNDAAAAARRALVNLRSQRAKKGAESVGFTQALDLGDQKVDARTVWKPQTPGFHTEIRVAPDGSMHFVDSETGKWIGIASKDSVNIVTGMDNQMVGNRLKSEKFDLELKAYRQVNEQRDAVTAASRAVNGAIIDNHINALSEYPEPIQNILMQAYSNLEELSEHLHPEQMKILLAETHRATLGGGSIFDVENILGNGINVANQNKAALRSSSEIAYGQSMSSINEELSELQSSIDAVDQQILDAHIRAESEIKTRETKYKYAETPSVVDASGGMSEKDEIMAEADRVGGSGGGQRPRTSVSTVEKTYSSTQATIDVLETRRKKLEDEKTKLEMTQKALYRRNRHRSANDNAGPDGMFANNPDMDSWAGKEMGKHLVSPGGHMSAIIDLVAMNNQFEDGSVDSDLVAAMAKPEFMAAFIDKCQRYARAHGWSGAGSVDLWGAAIIQNVSTANSANDINRAINSMAEVKAAEMLSAYSQAAGRPTPAAGPAPAPAAAASPPPGPATAGETVDFDPSNTDWLNDPAIVDSMIKELGTIPDTGISGSDYQARIAAWMINHNVPRNQADQINTTIAMMSANPDS
tara:strand:- start:2365 stop:4305 length:1941 start_codon:yes stop_codon:yes gene_type:complete